MVAPEGSTAPGRVIAFVLPEPTILLNPYLRTHWTKRRKLQLALAWSVRIAMAEQRQVIPPTPFARAVLRIERHSVKSPDYDGMVGGFKMLIDCLLPVTPRRPWGLGVLIDDSPKFVTPDFPLPFLVRRAAERRTVVRIQEMPITQ